MFTQGRWGTKRGGIRELTLENCLSLTIQCGEYNVDSGPLGRQSVEGLRGLILENCLSPRVDESALPPCSHGCHTRTAMQGFHTGHVVGHTQVCVAKHTTCSHLRLLIRTLIPSKF